MSHTSMLLTGLMLLAMVVFFAPNIFALNRGNILRNIALWLAIFLGLALIYQNFGPDGKYPLFNTPNSMMGMRELPPDNSAKDAAENQKDEKPVEGKDAGEAGYAPPKE